MPINFAKYSTPATPKQIGPRGSHGRGIAIPERRDFDRNELSPQAKKHQCLGARASPREGRHDKTTSDMDEVAARGGKFAPLTDERGMKGHESNEFRLIRVPLAHSFISPLTNAVRAQLLIYHGGGVHRDGRGPAP